MIRKPDIFDNNFGPIGEHKTVSLTTATEMDPRKKRDEMIERENLINLGDPLSLLFKEKK